MILKRIICLCLLAVFIFQIFGKVFIVADYYINKDFISKVLCINRDKPQINCEGRCHLKKQLEKEEKKEQSPVNSFKTKNEIQLFSEKKNGLDFALQIVSDQIYPSFLYPVSGQHLFSVFHPPKV